MHKDNFVIAVKHNGKVLREINGREVKLPFDSEYSLLLKNNNYRRAVCSVKIDSVDVLGGRELIINGNSSLDLERFLANGNLNNGNRFKFVKLEDGRVTDKDNPENGLVEIEFWLEKFANNITWTTTTWPNTQPYSYTPFYFSNTTEKLHSGIDIQYSSQNNVNVPSSITIPTGQNISLNNNNVVQSSLNVGATVEGSESQQKFSDIYFGQKDYPSTILKLWLRNGDLAVTTDDDLHCVKCGKKVKYEWTYCPKCATLVEK